MTGLKGLADYHVHTRRCGHASGEANEYVNAAKAIGLREIGFADHIPQYFLPPGLRDPGLAMEENELGDYAAEVLENRSANKDIVVRLGIEADFAPGHEKALNEILRGYPFDYVLGSVHYINGWGFDNPEQTGGYSGREIDDLYREYFGLVRQMVSTGLFDVVAHPDLLKKFGYRPESNILPLYEETVRAIAAAGMAVEVNTSGLRQPVKEIYPHPEFMGICRRYGVPVTLGSDAHNPVEVGRNFEEALVLLHGAGYRESAVFENRRRTQRALP
ncbi:MAG: histidinol-phosphatase HisJ family protein [Bacillota bacterium]